MSSHPQPTMPPRQFSPQQSPPNQTYQLPPNKRTKLSPVGMTLTMPSATTTPLASPQPHTPTPISTSTITTTTSHIPYSTAKLAPLPAVTSMPSMPPVITNMGPPSINPAGSFSNDATRQASRPANKAANTYDMDDMLMGTDIDLEEEAELMNNLESRVGSQNNVYGPGPAIQSSAASHGPTQEEIEAEIADNAWNEAAMRYARAKSLEITNSFLEPGIIHKRLQDAAHKHGLGLNLDLKPDGGRFTGRHQNSSDFPKPEIKPNYRPRADGSMLQTLSSSIPPDAYLVDQLALLSLGTKQRLRELLGDANRIATTRQTSAHGVIPQEWQDVAVPLPIVPTVNGTQGEGPRTGAESAVSPRTNPLKRTADELSNGLPTPISEASPTNPLIDTMTSAGKTARDAEELRLRKRQKRQEKLNGEKEGADGTSRAGSVAPGTPGSIAPEPGEKPPPKKESKKAASKQEASSTTVNQTLGLFVGSKKKKYAWMTNAGGPGSGVNTPRLSAGGAPGTPGSMAAANNKARQGPLTKQGVSHLGQFREDSDKGKNIQLRDWVVVLEEHGIDPKSLQHAYDVLDRSWRMGVESTTT
ncbi:hypothetical protein F4781DRAFT_380606 [Annulohypoxylon bovei var. microspora]|nr:hypothetical protein F4781DRAFT_380606 [Annulohypoxylon bovei var. microspora]